MAGAEVGQPFGELPCSSALDSTALLLGVVVPALLCCPSGQSVPCWLPELEQDLTGGFSQSWLSDEYTVHLFVTFALYILGVYITKIVACEVALELMFRREPRKTREMFSIFLFILNRYSF